MCKFCALYRTGKTANFVEGGFWVQFDIHPVSPGHMLIIPIRHVEKKSELDWQERATLWHAEERATKLIESLGRDVLKQMYLELVDARITDNSVWFCKRALEHRRLGQKPEGYNYVVNEGEAAGQTEMHLHFHLIPRFNGDVEDPRGGGRYVIPHMDNYTAPRLES